MCGEGVGRTCGAHYLGVKVIVSRCASEGPSGAAKTARAVLPASSLSCRPRQAVQVPPPCTDAAFAQLRASTIAPHCEQVLKEKGVGVNPAMEVLKQEVGEVMRCARWLWCYDEAHGPWAMKAMEARGSWAAAAGLQVDGAAAAGAAVKGWVRARTCPQHRSCLHLL